MTLEINSEYTLNILETPSKQPRNEMPLNHPLTLLEAPLKHLWNKYETIM